MRRRALAIVAVLAAGACTERAHDGSRVDAAPAPRLEAAPSSSAASPTTSSSAAAAGRLADDLVGAPYATTRPASSAAVPSGEWTWRPYRGDGFTILFPGEPKVTALPPEDDKAGYTEAKLDMPGGQVSFAAGFTEHTAEEVRKPEAFLDERVNTPRRGLTDVLHKRALTLPGGQPGRVLILRRNISGTPLRVYSRLYLVGRRLYSLIVSTLDTGGVGEDVVKRFMESWKLL
jgi:hypothetical protein